MSLFLIVGVVFAAGAATCLYSGAGPIDRSTGAVDPSWHPVLETIAECLTLPVSTPGIADIRDVALPVVLGIALLAVLFAGFARPRDARSPIPDDMTDRGANPAERWIRILALAITIIASISAFANDSMDLSRGWIVRFVIGAGWAILIARTFRPEMVRPTINGLLGLALFCMVLTIAHRADRGFTHFIWPIGPITITGSLAAVWVAMAGTYAMVNAMSGRRWRTTLFAILVCVVALYVLHQTGRRAPMIGLAAGLFVVASITLSLRFHRYQRRVWAVVALAALCGIVACAVYVQGQLKDPVRIKSGPVALRMALWQASGEMIAGRPLLGYGPEIYIVEMTNHLAPGRSISPHFYHGNINISAHNEWLQTAMELGIPAALLYAALPMGVLILTIRKTRLPVGPRTAATAGEHDSSVAINLGVGMPFIAGLTVILVSEAASITLRGPIMPAWYWTLLGLVTVACGCPSKVLKQSAEQPNRREQPTKRLLSSAILASAAALCLLVTFSETVTASAEANNTPGKDGRFGMRLFAEKTLLSQWRAAKLASSIARAKPDSDNTETALSLWTSFYERMPGFRETPARYAAELAFTGASEEAKRVLEQSIASGFDTFGREANVLYARLLSDPLLRFQCVQRALRSSQLDDALKAILLETLGDPSVKAHLQAELPKARKAATATLPDDETTAEPVVELLRIGAFLHERTGNVDMALAEQRLAAEFYRKLEQGAHPHRRAHDAESGAYLTLARMLYEHRPQEYMAAYQAIVIAEYYAVLGISHEKVANPNPADGYVGGVVVPTELPDRLFPLWRLSARLHLAVGHDQYLDLRILSGLPASHRTTAELNRQLARLARQVHRDLSVIPEADRPQHYGALLDMARRYEASTPPALSQQQ